MMTSNITPTHKYFVHLSGSSAVPTPKLHDLHHDILAALIHSDVLIPLPQREPLEYTTKRISDGIYAIEFNDGQYHPNPPLRKQIRINITGIRTEDQDQNMMYLKVYHTNAPGRHHEIGKVELWGYRD